MSFKRINSVVLPHVNKSIFTCAVVILGFIAAGCSNIKNSFKEESPRDKYEQMISKAGILNTSMGKSWKEMGEKSLFDSLSILLPFREDGYFFTEKTDAISYRFKARRGEKISISVTTDSIRHLALFMDLFSVNVSSNVPERTAFAGNNRELSILYPVKKDQTLILRLQPELLNGGRYTLIIKTLPSLVFPIRDKHGDAIGGLFGDSRDGGHRRHEGVDIFAKKGTPVVSASDGIVTRTGEDNLGGKIIMISNLRNESFYYAHLDSQLVNVGTYIKAGEIIGLVGNTGNAKYTQPHLHFGIYAGGEGAINPYPFIYDLDKDPMENKTDKEYIGQWVRIKSQKITFKRSTEKNSKAVLPLPRNSLVRICAAGNNHFRILLPDGRYGFVVNPVFEGINKPFLKRDFRKEQAILDLPGSNGTAITLLNSDSNLSLYGEFNDYYYVKYNNSYGWITK